MGCIIKYKGQSIPEEQFIQYLNKQIAINNLFNENKTLANAVYEALGISNKQETVSEIYLKLGNKTKKDNIVIQPVYQIAGIQYAKSIGGIFSLRVNNTNNHFGNPFSSVESEIQKGLIRTKSTKESVEKYIEWILSPITTIKPEQHKFIREVLQSGKLKEKSIVYYKELGESSHATALDYLINKYNWNSQITPQQKQQALQLYSQYLDTIFPDSKVKDIVYHGSNEKFDTVDVSKSKFQKGFYFAKDKNIAEGYGNTLALLVDSKNIQVQPFAHFGYYVDSKESLNKELLNINSLLQKGDFENALALQLIDVTDEIKFFKSKEEKEDFKKSNSGWENVEEDFLKNKIKELNTSIRNINEKGEFDTMLTHNDDGQLSLYAVGKPEQIHILGSKQDIQGFKSYVQNKQSVTPRQGISELFAENPQLASIGTQEQYERYLSTIFPDSKVKDIVYHGTDGEFDKFSKNIKKVLEREISNTANAYFFTNDLNRIKDYGKNKVNALIDSREILSFKNISNDRARVLSDITYEKAKGYTDKNIDSIVADYDFYKDYIVFEPEQIHILSSKQDIEGFKKFVENNPIVEETTTPDVEYSLDFDFPFQEESADKINKGIKSVIVRPVNLKSGTYNIGNQVYNIKNYGLYNIEDYLKENNITKEEFINQFIQDENVKYDHIKLFLDGKTSMYIYDIQPTTSELSIDIKLTPYERALNKLTSNLEAVKKQYFKEKNEEYKFILRKRIKALEKRIKDLKYEENQIIPFLLQQAFEHIDEAFAYLSNGHIVLASQYLNTYLDLFPTEGYEEDLLNQIKLFNQKLSDLETAITKASEKKVSNEVKAPIGGYRQEDKWTSKVLSAATSNNPLIRYAHQKIVNIVNTIEVKQNLFIASLKNILKLLGDIKNPKEFFNYMLQTDENGELTGYTISEFNHKYITDKYKVIPNFNDEKVTNRQIETYLNFLRNNHNIQIDEEAYNQYLAEGEKNIRKSNIVEGTRNLEDIINDKINYMLMSSNPVTFLNILTKSKRSSDEIEWAKRFLAYTKSYVKFNVTNPIYLDSKFTELQAMNDNDPRKIFYNFYTNTIKKARLEDPSTKHSVSLTYIPELPENVAFLTKMSNLPYYLLAEIPEDKREYFEDPTTGESMMSIPDGNMLNKKLSAKNKSYDLPKILQEFITASINKAEKEKIEDDIKILMNVVKAQPEYRVVNGNIQFKDGKPQLATPLQNNSFEQLKYFVEAHMYDKRQDKDGVFSKMLYDPELEKNYQQAKENLEKNLITEEEFKAIEKQRNDSGRVVTGKKLTNNLINYTAIKSLGFNFFSGVAELFQSFSSMYVEAAGGKFFTDSDLKLGFLKTYQLLKNPDELEKWYNNFPLLSNFGYDTPKGKWTDTAFWFFKQSEKISKGSLLFARLNAIKIPDSSGNLYSLLDAIKFDENGAAYLDGDFTESFEIGSEFRNKVINEIHALSRTLLARDNKRDPIALNKNFYGRLLGQFKASWLFEGITRRFSKEYTSELGVNKGYFRSVFMSDGSLNSSSIKKGLQILWTAHFNPDKLKEFNIEGLDEENVRKTLREFKIIASLTLTYFLAKALAGYDDDEDEWDDIIGSDFIINSAWRFNRDLTYFVNPESTIDLLGSSPMASISTIKQGLELIKAAGETAIGNPYLYEDTKRERLKIGAKIEPLIPFYSGVKKTLTKFTELD